MKWVAADPSGKRAPGCGRPATSSNSYEPRHRGRRGADQGCRPGRIQALLNRDGFREMSHGAARSARTLRQLTGSGGHTTACRQAAQSDGGVYVDLPARPRIAKDARYRLPANYELAGVVSDYTQTVDLQLF